MFPSHLLWQGSQKSDGQYWLKSLMKYYMPLLPIWIEIQCKQLNRERDKRDLHLIRTYLLEQIHI